MATTSVWQLDSAAAAARSASGAGSAPPPERSEVTVVGAGVTGLLIAVELLRRGRQVTVVESRSLAAGTTGRSTAKVTTLHGRSYSKIRKHRGRRTAQMYAAANTAGFEQVRATVQGLDTDVGWGTADAFTYTTAPGSVGTIESEAAAAADAGLDVDVVATLDLPFRVERAVRLRDQAFVDPVRLCLALATWCRDHGAQVIEGCGVLAIDRGEVLQVHTERGPIESRAVVMATLLPLVDPTLLFARVEPTMSYSLAAQLAEPVPDGMYLGIDEPSRSIRPAARGSSTAILGGGGHRVGEGGDTMARVDELRAWARSTFAVEEVTAEWSAHDLSPADGVPFVGRLSGNGPTGLFVAAGFQKWGFTNAGAASLAIADSMDDRPPDWAGTFDPRRLATDPRSVAKTVEGNIAVTRHFIGDRIATLRPPSIDSLEPGSGAVCERAGTKLAAFRSEDGELTVRSARCPHLGCLVAWNGAERSWDCPCHGSRFDVDGTVLAGPATLPLSRIEGQPPGSPTAD